MDCSGAAQSRPQATDLIDRIRCSGTTKANNRCLRTVSLPGGITHSPQETPCFCGNHLIQALRWITSNTSSVGRQCSGTMPNGVRCAQMVPVPHDIDAELAVHCVLHPTGIQLRKDPRTSIKDDRWLPPHIQGQAKEKLKAVMKAPVTSSDGPGYLYSLEYPDRKDPKIVHIRMCRTADRSSIPKRMRDLKKNCQHPVVVVRGPWPTTYSRLSKRLVTIELKELNQKESNPGRSCLGCGKVHIDTFTFRNDSDTAEEISKKQVAPVVERWAKLIEISK